jgi:putative heme transporter
MTSARPPAVSQAKPPSRGQVLGRIALVVAILVFVFGVFLPRLVDYNAVREAFAKLSPGQLLGLAAATVVGYIANAAPNRFVVPGLGWVHAVAADLSARAVASTIPGPTDIATRWVLYRGWGIPSNIAMTGIAFGAFFETSSPLVLPLISTSSVLLTGGTARASVLWLTLIGVLVLLATAALISAIVRSESFARRFGDWLERTAGSIWRFFRRTPPTGIADKVMDIRSQSMELASRSGARGFAAAIAARLAWFVVLEAALWSVGLGPDVLPPSFVLAAMAAVAIVALIPITPGAVGVSEVAYIGLLSAVAGEGATEAITAAVLIFRVAQWLIPIPIGWIILLILRRDQLGDLLGVHSGHAPHEASGADSGT